MSVTTRDSFGALVRRYRRSAELTQEGLAERSGLSVRAVRDIESGSKHQPRPDTVQLLLVALAVPEDEQDFFRAAALAGGSDEGEGRVTGSAATVKTFLIADIRGYSAFTVEHGDAAAAQLAGIFADLATVAAKENAGEVIELRGDEALAVFDSSRHALRAAVRLQQRWAEQSLADSPLSPRIGVGLDAGEAIPVQQGGYRGAALNLAARLCSLAGPGEVLASDTVANLARKVEGISYEERGLVELKGFVEPVRVMQVRTAEEGHDVRSSIRPGSDQVLPVGGFLGALPSGTLVGREQPLAHVLETVGRVGNGEGRLVLLAGEPGAGKTRLAQEATIHLRNAGFLIAAGRCYEPEQTVPYYPFLDVLTTVYTNTSPALQRDAARRWPYLGALLPGQIGVPEVAGGTRQDEQQRVARSVTEFLEAAAGERPLAVLLDDLHWADAASIGLLLHLARHTRTAPVLILGTYRTVEVNRRHPLEGALRDLHREDLMERVDVTRLDQGGTATLVAVTMGEETISDEFAALVHGRTEGNPYFVQQVLRVLVERGDVFRAEGRWDRRAIEEIEVPESVRSVVGHRLDRLTEATQQVLHEASVLGQRFQFDDLLAISERDERELEAALEEATHAALIRDLGHDAYGFDHALTQQSIYGELSARRKRRLHLAAGAALEKLPERTRDERSAEIAWQYLRGDDSERALPYAERAGDQAVAVFAYADAETHYRTAVDLAQERGDDARAADLLWKLGNVVSIVARYDDALAEIERAAQAYRRAGLVDEEARAVLEAAMVHYWRGSQFTGQAAIDELMKAHATRVQTPYLSMAAALREFMGAFLSGNLQDGLPPVERGAAVARSLGDARTIAWWESMRGAGLRLTGRPAEAVPVQLEAIEWAEASSDLLVRHLTLIMLSETYLFQGDSEQAIPVLERALEVTERMNNQGQVAYMLGHLSQALALHGDWPEARRRAEQAVVIAEGTDRSWGAALPLLRMADLCVLEGSWEEAERNLTRATAIAEDLDDPQWREWALDSWAELEFMQGRLDSARALYEQAAKTAREGIGYLRPILASIYLETGALEQAEETIQRGTEQAVHSSHPLQLVPWLRLQAMLLAASEKWDEAAHAFEEAVSFPRSLPYPYAEADALYEWGRMESRRGQMPRARELLEEALAIFRRLGAKPYSERVEVALGELGRVTDGSVGDLSH